MALQLAKPIQITKPTISNKNQSDRRTLLLRASGNRELAPLPAEPSYAAKFSSEKLNELLGMGYTKQSTSEGFTLIAPSIEYQKYWDRAFRGYMQDPANPNYSKYFGHYVPADYYFDETGLMSKSVLRNTYTIEMSSTGGWVIYGVRDNQVNQYNWTSGELQTTIDNSQVQTFLHIAQQAEMEKKGTTSSFLGNTQQKVAYEYDIQIGPTKYPVKALKEPTYQSTRNYFADNKKNAVFTLLEDLPVGKKKGEEEDVSGFIEVSPNLYNEFLLDNFGVFPTRKGKWGLDEFIPFADKSGTKKYYLAPSSSKEEALSFARNDLIFNAEIAKKDPFLVKIEKDVPRIAKSVGSIGLGFLKFTAAGQVKSETLRKDADFQNFQGAAIGIYKTVKTVGKGFGKASYAFADITLVRAIGSNNRDAILPAFDWNEVDRRKENKGKGSYLGKYALENDPDVQAFGVTAAFGLTAWLGAGYGGVLLVESAGIAMGAKEVVEGSRAQDYERIGPGLLMFLGGRPVKKVSRPFKEVIFERVPTVDVFADVAGKKVSASSLQESLGLFKKGKSRMSNQLMNEKIEVISISDKPFNEYRNGYVRTGFGEKGAAGLEDRGVFAASKGRGNVMFSGIPGTATYEGYTLNPLVNLGMKPTASKIWIDKVARQPRRLIKRPGFTDDVRTEFFDKKMKGTGFGSITKRSEIGQGKVRRQKFNVLEDINLRTVGYKKGQRVMEAGTSEIELTIGPGEVLKTKKRPTDLLVHRIAGFRQYTRYGAKHIPFTDIEIPLTGEFVRIQEYNLMKWRKAKGFAGKNDIWTEKQSKVRMEREIKKLVKSESTSKSKIYYPSALSSKKSSSSSLSRILSQISSKSSSKSRSSSSNSISSSSSRISSSRSSISKSLGSSSFGSSSRSSISRSLSSSKSSSRSSRSGSLSTGKSSKKVPKFKFKNLLGFEKPKNSKLGFYRNYREFRVNTKAFFGMEVD